MGIQDWRTYLKEFDAEIEKRSFCIQCGCKMPEGNEYRENRRVICKKCYQKNRYQASKAKKVEEQK